MGASRPDPYYVMPIARAATSPHRIQRRRVPVKVELFGRRSLSGAFYADVVRPDGSSGRVLDRLNRTEEHFIPLAVEGSHILVRKSSIALVRLENEQAEVECGNANVHLEFVVRLIDGSAARGVASASLPSSRSRALDYLNFNDKAFIALGTAVGRVTIVNVALVETVTEVLRTEPTES